MPLFWLATMMPAADWPTLVMVLDRLKVPALTVLLPPAPPTPPVPPVPVAAVGQAPLEPVPIEGSQVPAGARLVQALVSRVQGGSGDLVDFTGGARIQAVLEAWERSSAVGTWVDVVQA